MAICITRKPLSRRALLRGLAAGAAVSVGLPPLEAMIKTNRTAFAAGAIPKRFGVWFWGNGMVPPIWNPTNVGVGSAWQLSEQLAPFAKVKQNMTVLTGFDSKVGGAVHREGPAAALSGAPPNSAMNYSLPTIDHVISKLIGGTTPFRSLEVGVSRATANGNGQTVNYASSSGANAPVQPEYDAKAVFTRLFGKAPTMGGAPTGAPDRTPQIRKRILDTIAEDAKALRSKLGSADLARLDQHLEGISQLEKRIAMIGTPAAGGGACNLDPAAADKYPALLADNNALVTHELNNAMADLTTYALSCDLTRVFLFQHGRPAAHYNMSVVGITTNIHDDISHKETGNQPQFTKAVVYWMTQFAYLLEKMQNTPDGTGNLLENSIVYASSDVSLGRSHSIADMPCLLFGKGGGVLKGDQHHKGAKDNMSKVLFTLANLYGANVPSFGMANGLVTSGVPEILA
ncbi:MAG TPA: DUF1552 domain-containing protein [Polyangia bacterium]